MKKWVLYIMSIVFCMGFFACTAEEGLVDNSGDKNNEEDVLVSFNLNIPSARTSSSDELDPGDEWERYIDETDIRVFVFKGDKYQEEVKGLFMDGNDGDVTRTLTGRITSSYNGEAVNLVVLTGMKSRKVAEPTLTSTTTTQDLYKQLIFDYNEAWSFSANEKKYIPMWGVSKGFNIEEGKINNAGTIHMYRAIAKIDIKVNNGNGIAGFKITGLELVKTPKQGYCAPLENPVVNGEPMEKPFFPNYGYNEKPFPIELDDDDNNTIKNKIYVPEMGFNQWGGYSHSFHIKITAELWGKEHGYSIYMRRNQTDSKTSIEIIRNHKYIININSITSEDNVMIGYTVSTWGNSTIELPFS